MIEKLGFIELVRYFLTGLIVAVGIGIARGITLGDAIAWSIENEWVADFAPSAVGAALILLIGYCSFTVYRYLGYWCLTIRLKRGLTKVPCCGRFFYSYRELILEILKGLKVERVTAWDAERLYRILRHKIEPEFYRQDIAKFTSGIHVLYFAAIVFIASFALAGAWWGVIGSAVVYFLALAFDIAFEREELLYFVAKRDALERELSVFRRHPVWGVTSREQSQQCTPPTSPVQPQGTLAAIRPDDVH